MIFDPICYDLLMLPVKKRGPESGMIGVSAGFRLYRLFFHLLVEDHFCLIGHIFCLLS